MIFFKIKSNNWFLSFSFHYFLLEEHVLPRTWLVPVLETQQIHQNRISKQWNQNQNKSYQSEIKPIKHMKKKKIKSDQPIKRIWNQNQIKPIKPIWNQNRITHKIHTTFPKNNSNFNFFIFALSTGRPIV